MRRAVYPLLVTSQSVPFIIIAPLLVIWFGFGLAPKLVLVTLVCAFPITVTFLEGLRSADHEALDLLRSMGAGRWDQFRLVQLPPALAALAAGAKIAATYAVIGALIAEWLGASRGLGVFLIRSMNSFRADRALARDRDRGRDRAHRLGGDRTAYPLGDALAGPPLNPNRPEPSGH